MSDRDFREILHDARAILGRDDVQEALDLIALTSIYYCIKDSI